MRKVFMSISAAEGNIGDVYIRRQVVRLFDECGLGGTLYSGHMSASYISAFGLSPKWKTQASHLRFLVELLLKSAVGRSVFVMAPGPAVLGRGVAQSAKHVFVALLLQVVRRLGNPVITLGRAVRGDSGVDRFFERTMVSSSSVYVVRDTSSTGILQHKDVLVAPDLAFTQVKPGLANQVRDFAAISLRYDRFIELAAFEILIQQLRAANLLPILVTQVKEDQTAHSALAQKFNIQMLEWDLSSPHDVQEAAVFEVYSRCAVVISDRLHSLIFGAISGAIPVIVDQKGESKLHSTLDFLLSPQNVWLDGKREVARLNLFSSEQIRVHQAVETAAERLGQTAERVRRIAKAPVRFSGSKSRDV